MGHILSVVGANAHGSKRRMFRTVFVQICPKVAVSFVFLRFCSDQNTSPICYHWWRKQSHSATSQYIAMGPTRTFLQHPTKYVESTLVEYSSNKGAKNPGGSTFLGALSRSNYYFGSAVYRLLKICLPGK